MPKQLIPAGWIEKPCRFFSPTSVADVCNLCDGQFSFWNSSRHCYFCGNVFHRKQCTSKCNVEGFLFKRRICNNCEYYKGCAAQLKDGEEFTCIRNGESDTLTISLCEETAELLLHWKGRNITEAVDLLGADTKKGYSLRARLRGSGNYDPLKSLTLVLTDPLGDQRALYINASSAWMCQMWVEGLKCARYVYQAMIRQDKALEFYTTKGIDISSSFKMYYLPRLISDSEQTMSSQQSPSFSISRMALFRSTREASLTSNTASSYSTDSSGCSPLSSPFNSKSGYFSDRADSPSPTHSYITHNYHNRRSGYLSDAEPTRRYGNKYKRKALSSSSSSRFSRSRPVTTSSIAKSVPIYERSTPGLPYVRSPLSSICPCHCYEIPVRGQKHTTGSKCCFRCHKVCPIAQDLENL